MTGRLATPKQVAYLTFMGVEDAASLTIAEAGQRIDSLFEVADDTKWNWLHDRQGLWITERYILYPELYASEFRTFIDTHFSEEMHTYVRARIVGASEKLTKQKITKVLRTLTNEDRLWWRAEDRKEKFFGTLSRLFPGCCDGGARTRSSPSDPTRPKQRRFSLFDHDTLYSLLGHYAEFCEPWEVSVSDGTTTAAPHEWLTTLDKASLTAPFTKKSSGDDGTFYTIEVKRLFRTVQTTFSVVWHTGRHGWADAGPGTRVVHYLVPRSWMVDPPRINPNSLLSLCKKVWITNDSPFYPVDPAREFCQKCCTLHETWNAQQK